MMDFDQQVPTWRPDPNALVHYLPSGGEEGKAITPFNAPNGPMSIVIKDEDGMFVECVVPHARYLRALDPAGNYVPVVISTNRVDTHDGTGYEDKVKRVKRAQGWLFLDDPPYGLDAEAWAERVEEEAARRREKHGIVEAKRGTNYKTHQEAMAEANSAMMEGLIRKMFKELRAIKSEVEGEEDDE